MRGLWVWLLHKLRVYVRMYAHTECTYILDELHSLLTVYVGTYMCFYCIMYVPCRACVVRSASPPPSDGLYSTASDRVGVYSGPSPPEET